jgi:hypothetical protein
MGDWADDTVEALNVDLSYEIGPSQGVVIARALREARAMDAERLLMAERVALAASAVCNASDELTPMVRHRLRAEVGNWLKWQDAIPPACDAVARIDRTRGTA